MKWVEPAIGQTRVKTRFLFLPKKIQKTTRWLELARWTQIYESRYNSSRKRNDKPRWHNLQWVEDAMISKLEGQP